MQREGREEKNRKDCDFSQGFFLRERRAQQKIEKEQKLEKHFIEMQHLAKDSSAALPSGVRGGGVGGGGGGGGGRGGDVADAIPTPVTTPAGRPPLATAARPSPAPPESVYKRRLEPENSTGLRQLATEANFKTNSKAPRRTPLSRCSLLMLCQILEKAGQTSKRDVANELVKAMEKEKLKHSLGALTVQEEGNIRRRCYDAVNCLDGLGIVSKHHHGRHGIAWNGILTDITSTDAYALNQSISRAAAAHSTAHVFSRELEQNHADECEKHMVRLAPPIKGGMQGEHAEQMGLEGEEGQGEGAAAEAARGAGARARERARAGGNGGDKDVGASRRPSILCAKELKEKETLTVLRQKRARVSMGLEHKVSLSRALALLLPHPA